MLCKDGSVLAHRGPMFLNILVVRGGYADTDLAQAGVNKAFSLLEELGENKPVLTSNIMKVDVEAPYPAVVQRMIKAALATGDKTLTPLIAVAGSVSDEVADFISTSAVVAKVVVNNGGDIAIRLADGQIAKVGINLDYFKPAVSHMLTISDKASGVATSGFGGRSFTKGIASASIVWASSASLADVLATILGNATNVDDCLIKRQLAGEIYPDTDIPGHWVTTSVGDISETKIEEALRRGMTLVSKLHQQGLVFEALLAVKGRLGMTEGMVPIISRVPEKAEVTK